VEFGAGDRSTRQFLPPYVKARGAHPFGVDPVADSCQT
jgi:hypothetical protein